METKARLYSILFSSAMLNLNALYVILSGTIHLAEQRSLSTSLAAENFRKRLLFMADV